MTPPAGISPRERMLTKAESRPLEFSGLDAREEAIAATIADVARNHLEWHGVVSRDLPLVEGFELDSLRQLTLVMEIENRFRIRFSEEDEASLVTVGDLIDAIGRKLDRPDADPR